MITRSDDERTGSRYTLAYALSIFIHFFLLALFAVHVLLPAPTGEAAPQTETVAVTSGRVAMESPAPVTPPPLAPPAQTPPPLTPPPLTPPPKTPQPRPVAARPHLVRQAPHKSELAKIVADATAVAQRITVVAPEIALAPTTEPSPAPSVATIPPTLPPAITPQPQTPMPTLAPTIAPMPPPTVVPTERPTTRPTAVPTVLPTAPPTARPTAAPTIAPTEAPTVRPTVAATARPTAAPPTAAPVTPAPATRAPADAARPEALHTAVPSPAENAAASAAARASAEAKTNADAAAKAGAAAKAAGATGTASGTASAAFGKSPSPAGDAGSGPNQPQTAAKGAVALATPANGASSGGLGSLNARLNGLLPGGDVTYSKKEYVPDLNAAVDEAKQAAFASVAPPQRVLDKAIAVVRQRGALLDTSNSIVYIIKRQRIFGFEICTGWKISYPSGGGPPQGGYTVGPCSGEAFAPSGGLPTLPPRPKP